MPWACELRNSPQVGPSRRGAGPSPLARSRVRILVAETRMPSLASSPRILKHPHLGFSLPIRRISSHTKSWETARCREPFPYGGGWYGHWMRITEPKELDDQLLGWLRESYRQMGMQERLAGR